ncbi:endonuclease VII domain-containing protein [Candidatus Pacearchaeota archaeon]|nr:endonuclease VII domain-containing protein [Candidatus Pacearchaeota archaeon]
MIKRICKRCGVERPITDFHIVKECLEGRRPVCKFCIRKQQKKRYDDNAEFARARQRRYNARNPQVMRQINLKKKYGIVIEEYNIMFESQGGVCLICGCSETVKRNDKIKNLAVDHNHVTGKVRGLLCQKCNQALGLLGENPVVIKSLLEYITNND